jgi:hypothetical protein
MNRLAALCLALVPLVASAQIMDPLNLFNRARAGDAAALAQLRSAAEAGDAASQFQLGRAYSHGSSILDRDNATAAQWVEKAAQQGHAEAQSNIGYLYSAGLGVPRSYDKALQWWTRAAEGGFVQAQYNLALVYLQGKEAPKDEAKAFLWMSKAAEQGAAPAQLNLGMMYGRGQGTPANPEQAAAWYRKAAEQGNETAMMNLGSMYANGDGIAKDPAEALRWLRRPLANGHPRALALRTKLCAEDAAACAREPVPEYFVFEMNDPRLRIVIPDAPAMTMGPHPLAATNPNTRFMGMDSGSGHSISILTPTADPGMGPEECAGSLGAALIRRFGLKRDDVVTLRPNQRTFVMLFPVKADPLLQLKAYLLSAAGGHCVEVHLSKTVASQGDIRPWFRGFQNARVEAPQ